EEEEEDGGEVVFADVAGAHPLVRKWEAAVREEARRWGVDLEVLGGEEGVVRVGEERTVGREDGKGLGGVKEKKALDCLATALVFVITGRAVHHFAYEPANVNFTI
ncbi:hypothetical protein NKR19_g10372, partial [Coniochaeta hoffmannii]